MDNNTNKHGRTYELLINHYKTYPNLEPEDIFKYIYQSSFGCGHFVSDEASALSFIEKEYESLSKAEQPKTEQLDGRYCRISLSHLNNGLKAETLAKLFCASSKAESDGLSLLEQKISIAQQLVTNRVLPLDKETFDKKLELWKASGYPALHHSDSFRREYKPSYRVVADTYADFLPVFTEIDKLSCKDSVVIAIEGASASGKTTLSKLLEQIYGCSVFHMDDFFLRPEQRTAKRLSEAGGNVDRERFLEEVLKPLREHKEVTYRPFDCSAQALCPPITVMPSKLTVIEGAYSMHPSLSQYYDFSVFLDIDSEYQKERINRRNPPKLAKRFFDEWIPLEIKYFYQMCIKDKCSLCVKVADKGC